MSYAPENFFGGHPLQFRQPDKPGWLRSNLAYARYIFLHKLYVLTEGWKLDVPLWRLLIHDWSKFLPSEWGAYREYFHGEKNLDSKTAFDVGWLKHIHRSPHHWNFWVCQNETAKVLKMPDVLVREMVADWISVGRVLKTAGVKNWYKQNASKIILHPETRERVEKLLGFEEETKIQTRVRFADRRMQRAA